MFRLSDLLLALLIRNAHRRVIAGCDARIEALYVRLDNADVDVDVDNVASKFEEALGLLQQFDPRLLSRIRTDAQYIFLLSGAQSGRYAPGLRTCCISMEYVMGEPPLDVAMMLVHEATHARIDRAGIPLRRRWLDRVERACVNAEIAFARRVPGSEEAIARTEALLETEWWTPEHDSAYKVAELKANGFPGWLAEGLGWFDRHVRWQMPWR